MDITSALLVFAGGGGGSTLLTWLLTRRRQSQLDVSDVAARYWKRIDELEARMGDLQLKVAKLEAENAMLKTQAGIGLVTP